MIEATVVCDSISPAGKRLTTFKLRYPKFIHGEFMTHRVISRNASSSRAIPTAKLIEEVRSDALRAAPIYWGKSQAGMQAVEELSGILDGRDMSTGWTQPEWEENTTGWGNDVFHDSSPRGRVQHQWRYAALQAAAVASDMNKLGAHKQVVNRLLEPFSHINVVATATEWDNFFGLRLHKDAQPEMRALAEAMWAAREASTPTLKKLGNWHLPFVDQFILAGEGGGHKYSIAFKMPGKGFASQNTGADGDESTWIDEVSAIKVSAARCARVSYASFETGKRSTVEEDLKLYDRLTAGLRDPNEPLHASPMEHQATPDDITGPFEIKCFEPTDAERKTRTMRTEIVGRWANANEHGNFVGWRQYRKMLSNEAVAPLPKEYVK